MFSLPSLSKLPEMKLPCFKLPTFELPSFNLHVVIGDTTRVIVEVVIKVDAGSVVLVVSGGIVLTTAAVALFRPQQPLWRRSPRLFKLHAHEELFDEVHF